jgi:hypothetical protein
MTESFFFPSGVLGTGTPAFTQGYGGQAGLISLGSSDMGVRLNIRRRSEAMAGQAYSDSVGPLPVLTCGQNRKRSSSPAIPAWAGPRGDPETLS